MWKYNFQVTQVITTENTCKGWIYLVALKLLLIITVISPADW